MKDLIAICDGKVQELDSYEDAPAFLRRDPTSGAIMYSDIGFYERTNETGGRPVTIADESINSYAVLEESQGRIRHALFDTYGEARAYCKNKSSAQQFRLVGVIRVEEPCSVRGIDMGTIRTAFPKIPSLEEYRNRVEKVLRRRVKSMG
jgi:hypothetical protein